MEHDLLKYEAYLSDLVADGRQLTRSDNKILNICTRLANVKTRLNRKNKQQPEKFELHTDKCYMCRLPNDNEEYMCSECHAYNIGKKFAVADLSGKIAIVTGGRVKIGFYTALKLLRCNARVIITTRFPHDARKRYVAETDSKSWMDRLHIIESNFNSLNSIQTFIDEVRNNYPRVDYLINNAAQTIERPPAFYKDLLTHDGDKSLTIHDPFFPSGVYDEHGQQIDLRPSNSWIETIQQVNVHELCRVLSINTIAPFFIIQQLQPLLTTSDEHAFIINVSSMEGKFNRRKGPSHPHTNMAKAGLNMLTKTIGPDFKRKYNIVVVAVDTGWNTIEEPLSYDIKAPLDCIDGAARILDPIYNKLLTPGVFYKNYKVTTW